MTVTNPNPETGCVGGGGGGGIQVDCCVNAVPETLKATFNSVSDDCDCANGAEIVLDYSVGIFEWLSGAVSLGTCGKTIGLFLLCPTGSSSVADWELSVSGCDQASPAIAPGSTCDPLNLIFDWTESGAGACCDTNPGSATITITE